MGVRNKTLTLDDFHISPRAVQVQSFGKMVILSPALRKKLRRSQRMEDYGCDDLLIVNGRFDSLLFLKNESIEMNLQYMISRISRDFMSKVSASRVVKALVQQSCL